MIETIAAKLNEWKKELGLTNQKLSDLSTVPKQSVDRILSASTERPSFENIMQMTLAMGHTLDELIGMTNTKETINDLPHYDLLLQSYKDQIESYQTMIKNVNEQHMEERRFMRKFSLIELCIIIFLVIALVALFTYDILNGNIGWFRYAMQHFNDALETMFGQSV